MPVIDITQTRQYQRMIRQHRALLDELGYADEDYEVQEYVLYHVLRDDEGFRSKLKDIAMGVE